MSTNECAECISSLYLLNSDGSEWRKQNYFAVRSNGCVARMLINQAKHSVCVPDSFQKTLEHESTAEREMKTRFKSELRLSYSLTFDSSMIEKLLSWVGFCLAKWPLISSSEAY